MNYTRVLTGHLIVLAAGVVTSSVVATAQSLDPRARPGFLAADTIELAVVDGRRQTDDYGKVPAFVESALRKAYPSAIVVLAPDSTYYRPARPGIITAKVQLVGYNKGFGIEAGAGIGVVAGIVVPMSFPQGKWNGISVLAVTMFDKRPGHDSKHLTTLTKVVSKSNTWGSRSGTQAMQESLSEVVNALLNYIDAMFVS